MWPPVKVSLTPLIYTNNFIDLAILSTWALSHVVERHGRTSIVLNYCLNLISIDFTWSTRPWSIVQREIPSTKLRKPLLACSVSHSTFSTHCTNFFFAFQLCFYLS